MQSSPFTLRTGLYESIDPTSHQGSLRGKVALVTGSSRGIGKAIAHALAQAGASVAVTGRSRKGVEAACTEISGHADARCLPFVADVLNQNQLEELIADVEEKLGEIDILVLNAGTNTFMPFHLTDSRSWWDIMELNVRAPVETTRLVLPSMRRRNTGTIVYLSSRAAQASLPWTTAYNCSKAAISRFAGTLQAELDVTQKAEGNSANNGIEVFSIHPGEVETDLHRTSFPERLGKDAPYVLEYMAPIKAKSPHYSPELPAWTVVFLASGKAKALRGQYVDCTRDIGEVIAVAELSR